MGYSSDLQGIPSPTPLFKSESHYPKASQVAPVVRTLLSMQEIQETWVPSLGRRDPLEEGMATHSVFLPGESHGQRSLAGYNLQGHREWDMTEVT